MCVRLCGVHLRVWMVPSVLSHCIIWTPRRRGEPRFSADGRRGLDPRPPLPEPPAMKCRCTSSDHRSLGPADLAALGKWLRLWEGRLGGSQFLRSCAALSSCSRFSCPLLEFAFLLGIPPFSPPVPAKSPRSGRGVSLFRQVSLCPSLHTAVCFKTFREKKFYLCYV